MKRVRVLDQEEIFGRLQRLFLVANICILVGCGGGGSAGGNRGIQEVEGALVQASASELESALKAGLVSVDENEDESGAQFDNFISAPTGGQPQFTGTYTQEANVDEYDTVRYDGEYLFVAPERIYNCCFAMPTGTAGDASAAPEPVRSIRLFKTDPDNAGAELVSSIGLDDNISVQGLYAVNDRLVALTSEQYFGAYGGLWNATGIWGQSRSGVQIYNVSNPGQPQLGFTATFDGVLVDSRRIGQTVYVVSRYTPQIDGLYYPPANLEQSQENQRLLNSVTLDDLLPKVEVNGQSQTMVAGNACYISRDIDPTTSGYPVITTVLAIPVDQPENYKAACYNEETNGIYVAEQSLYLTQLLHNGENGTHNTKIHKFSLSNTPTYVGSGEVEGASWRGGQLDFRMSELNGDLRLMTTQVTGDSPDLLDHHLFVLRENVANKTLDIVGQLPQPGSEIEIGKPNEDLYGVRFFGDRAYAVTFERIDPLYVIDLANPSQPSLSGELMVTGFSDFLHPVNEALLLGLGRDESGGIKLELFDVMDITNPMSIGVDVIGDSSTYSEALHNRHAFTYQADYGEVDRFVIPVNAYGQDVLYSSALYLYEIWDKTNPSVARLHPQGLLVPENAAPFSGYRQRAYLHDDSVFYVHDNDVFTGRWSSPSQTFGPFQ